MSFRRKKPQPAHTEQEKTSQEGKQVRVTLLEEGHLVLHTQAQRPGLLTPGFYLQGMRYSLLEINVRGMMLTREVGLSCTIYCLIRDIDPLDQSDVPELFVDSAPRAVVELPDGEFYTMGRERAVGELKWLRAKLEGTGDGGVHTKGGTTRDDMHSR